MSVHHSTITIEVAIKAIRAYNSGLYRGVKNIDLDCRARQMFSVGLSITPEGILEQVRFIGKDYGGVAAFPVALSLAPAIANDIYAVRDRYAALVRSAPPLLVSPSSSSVVAELYTPFVKLVHGKRKWQVWAAKFWHFLNPDAFPIEDSRVDKFFGLAGRVHSVDKYVTFLHRFREFAIAHQDWLVPLREADEGHSWCENKLWDKLCYGVVELDKLPRPSMNCGR
jgi:hypothetical protein